MSRAEGGIRRRSTRAARLLALGLCFAEMGCTAITELRSEWNERPSLLGWWDRREESSPDPAADYYAQYMHAARSRRENPAGDNANPTTGTDGEEGRAGPSGPGDSLAAGPDGPAPRSRRASPGASTPRAAARDDDPLEVTLGMPEPLPVVSGTGDAALASARAAGRDEDGWSSPPRSRDGSDLRLAHRAEVRPDPGPAEIEPEPAPRPAPASTSTSAPRRPDRPARPSPASREREGRAILARSEEKLRALDTYQVKMSRVERVDGRLQPEEEVVLSVHRQPREVRLEWESGPSQGREVIYSTRVDARSLFVHMPKSAIPLPTMKMAIDSPMVTKSSRHSISEAGFDIIVENLRKSVDQVDSANTAKGRAAYRGVEKPPGLDRPSHVFTRKSASGETWTVFIDERTMLPSMVVAKDAKGELDEKYVYHEVLENPAALATADAFDPDRRWGASPAGGLLSRFTRAAAGGDSTNNSQPAPR